MKRRSIRYAKRFIVAAAGSLFVALLALVALIGVVVKAEESA